MEVSHLTEIRLKNVKQSAISDYLLHCNCTINFGYFSILATDTGFDIMTHDSYFLIPVEVFVNHILAENTCFMNHIKGTEHKVMLLKLANKNQIIQQHHYFRNIFINSFQHHPFLYQAKVL